MWIRTRTIQSQKYTQTSTGPSSWKNAAPRRTVALLPAPPPKYHTRVPHAGICYHVHPLLYPHLPLSVHTAPLPETPPPALPHVPNSCQMCNLHLPLSSTRPKPTPPRGPWQRGLPRVNPSFLPAVTGPSTPPPCVPHPPPISSRANSGLCPPSVHPSTLHPAPSLSPFTPTALLCPPRTALRCRAPRLRRRRNPRIQGRRVTLSKNKLAYPRDLLTRRPQWRTCLATFIHHRRIFGRGGRNPALSLIWSREVPPGGPDRSFRRYGADAGKGDGRL